MRFIGSKLDMLTNIENVIKNNIDNTAETFIDLFAGTGIVGEHFKNQYKIISNDYLYLSYALNYAKIKNNETPKFLKLATLGIDDPIEYLNTANCRINKNYFVTHNYSPHNKNERMYVTVENAKRIDFIRTTLENWKNSHSIDESEFYYLLACLLEAVSSISNTTGTYGAYLKEWDPRALKDITLVNGTILNNNRNNKVFNQDANQLVKQISADICYIDTPYNNRQYLSNYHVLETIARYDFPEISGITGIRTTAKDNGSLYSKKATAHTAFDDLISNINAKHLIVSYSSDGILSKEELENMLKQYGNANTFKRYDIPYPRYQGKKVINDNELKEYLFYIEKEITPNYKTHTVVTPKTKTSYSVATKSKELLASPMNYIGGKHKILPQILPLFPKQIKTFVDLFAGGYNVGINVEAEKIVANDINNYVIEILDMFKKTDTNKLLSDIDNNIKLYNLSKTNMEGFLNLRSDYNQNPSPLKLYTLVCYSFNYQFRFNNSHDYNNPFGKNRSHFSPTLRNKLIKFVSRLKEQDVVFQTTSFEHMLDYPLSSQDFVYCDPPYLITTGSYNDGNRGFKDWTVEQERRLYMTLDALDEKNIPFALSNVIEHKGRKNEILLEWKQKYNTHKIVNNYSNSSHNTSKGISKEVLITNY